MTGSRTALFPRHMVSGLVVFLALGGLAFENGGFFPRAWTMAAVTLLWIAALALLFAARVTLTTLECLWLALLGGLLAWTALSASWSLSHADSLPEFRRGLVYLAGVGTVLILATRRSAASLLAAVWAAVTLVVVYALARYLFAPKVHSDVFQANLLFRPLGYANGLGIFAGLAAILAVALAARAPSRILRTLAAASLAPLAAAVELTSSRAAALAACIGLAAMLTVDRQRLQLLGELLVVSPAVAAVVVLSEHSRLTDPASIGAAAERRAHLLAVWIVLGTVALGLAHPTLEKVGPALARRPLLRQGVPAAVVAATAVLAALLVASGWAARFFTTGYRPAYWHVAWREYLAHPWLGSGAGTFGNYWVRYGNPTLQGGALDAHNLYLETLAEVGPLGLALLIATLALPLFAVLRARRAPLSSAAMGAYVAFLAHAALDWDWELPAVTLAGLVCAASVVVTARDGARMRQLSVRTRGGALALALALAVFALAAQFVPGLGGRYP